MAKSNRAKQLRAGGSRRSAKQALHAAAVPFGVYYSQVVPPYDPPVAVDVVPMRRWIHLILPTPTQDQYYDLKAKDLFPTGKGLGEHQTCFVHKVYCYSKGSTGQADNLHISPKSCNENDRGNAWLPILMHEAPEPGTRASIGYSIPPTSGFAGGWSLADTQDQWAEHKAKDMTWLSVKPVNFTGHCDIYVDASYL